MSKENESKYPLKGYGPLEYIVFIVMGLVSTFFIWLHATQLIEKGFSFSLLLKSICHVLGLVTPSVLLILLRTKYYKLVMSKEKKHVLGFILFILLVWAGARFL